MYFKDFPYTYYTLDDRQTIDVVTNILTRNVITDEVKTNYVLYDEYDIKDGETPEILADKFYNNPQYHWVILLLNEILDPRYDWVLSTNNLIKYCQSKYDNIYATHHYEDADGYIVNSTEPGSTAISNYTYEDRLNENKRRIKILKPIYVEAVVSEFSKKIKL